MRVAGLQFVRPPKGIPLISKRSDDRDLTEREMGKRHLLLRKACLKQTGVSVSIQIQKLKSGGMPDLDVRNDKD